MAFEFKFPDVGEGITEGELLSWKVKQGDVVVEDQTLAEVETDKAVVEIPSPRAGRIAKLHVEENETIEVGQVLVTIEEGVPAGQPASAPAADLKVAPAPAEEEVPPPARAPAPFSAPPEEPAEAPMVERPAAGVERGEDEDFYTGSVVGQLEEAPEEEQQAPAAGRPPTAVPRPPAAAVPPFPDEGAGVKVQALPSVRQLAKELGVDITLVHGTGPGGRVLRQDVEDMAEAAAYGRTTVEAPSVPVAELAAAEAWMGGRIEQDEHGVVERVTFKGVRRTMARRMSESVAKQAQVTTTDEADVTILRRIREKERTLAAERGVRLTYLAFVIKACGSALKRFPRLNAVLNEGCDEFVLKRYYNIGIAVDTKAGLMVPNIKDVDRKSIFTIAEEIIDLVERAQQRRLRAIGAARGHVHHHELRGHRRPVRHAGDQLPGGGHPGHGPGPGHAGGARGEVVIRQMLPLCLTFDHQLIDGAEATRFLNLVISYLEDPDLLLLESV